MANKEVFNATDSPVVIDENGSMIEGRTSKNVNTDDEMIAALIERGALVVREKNEEPKTSAPTKTSAKKADKKQEDDR